MTSPVLTIADGSASSRARWLILVTIGLSMTLVTLDNSILYTALPTLTAELGASASEALWIVNAYPLFLAGLLLGSGALGDRFGHRRIFLIGLVVFGVASLAAAFSPTAWILIAARSLLAVGASLMLPATIAILRQTFPVERERNLALAIWGSISVIGSTLGPILGGLLLESFWWGSVFLINVPVVLVAIIATVITVPSGSGDRSISWDAVSSVQALVGLGALVLFIEEIPRAEKNWVLFIAAPIVAAVALIFFVRRQRGLTAPLLDFSLFRSPMLSAAVIAAALASLVTAGVQLVTTQRFQAVEEFSPFQAGLLVTSIALGTAITGVAAGALLHRVGARPLLGGGLAVTATGVAFGALMLPLGWGWLALGLFVAGLGAGSAMATGSILIATSTPDHRSGMAGAIEGVTYEFGTLIAIASIGSVFTSIALTADPATAHTIVLWAVAIAIAIATPITIRMLRATALHLS